MSDNDCREICRDYLDNESEDRIKIENPKSVYDQAYVVFCSLINKREEFRWSDMKKVLNKYNKEIVKKFTQKFKEADVEGQSSKSLIITGS